MEVETTGNAFSKNFIILRHFPNGDPSRIPSPGQSLLNAAEAYDRKSESVKLQLDSNSKGICKAPWNLSYNPQKPINDTDPSERNLGVFVIVSNGSPGTDPVDITVRFRYNFRFFGPIYAPLIPDNSKLAIAAPVTNANIFGNAIVTGDAPITFTTNKITFLSDCRVTISIQLTGTSAVISAPVLAGIVASNAFTVTSATASQYFAVYDCAAGSSSTLAVTGVNTNIKVVIGSVGSL